MSNIYHTEPVTSGKVIIHTTVGDFDVELWANETPVACKNFCQLCLEGYYDGLIFHRVIPQFMAQTGDPSGTGSGGESIYGKPFKDEFHQRIRFNHRGQVALANPNLPDCNQSQFFLTLAPCEWLNKKHTIFGKVTGNTVYNLPKFSDVETDPDTDKPLDPPRIISTEVISTGSLGSIVPRESHSSKTQSETELLEKKRKEREKETAISRKKNKALISFGDDDDDDDDFAPKTKKKKTKITPMVKHTKISTTVQASEITALEKPDISDDQHSEQSRGKAESLKPKKVDETDSRHISQEKKMDQVQSSEGTLNLHTDTGAKVASKQIDEQVDNQETMLQKDSVEPAPLSGKQLEKKQLKDRAKARMAEMNAAREAARKRTMENQVAVGRKAADSVKAQAEERLMSVVEQRRMKYLQQQKNVKSRQQETLAMLSSFKSKLANAQQKKTKSPTRVTAQRASDSKYRGGIGDNLTEEQQNTLGSDDDSTSWMTTKLKFKRHIDDAHRMNGAFNPSAEDYAVIDPKTKEGRRYLEKSEKRERSKTNRKGFNSRRDGR